MRAFLADLFDTSIAWIIVIAVMTITFIFCLIKLSKKCQETDTTNIYGVTKDTETDETFKKCSKIMLKSGIISLIVFCVMSFVEIILCAEGAYDYYSSDYAYERYLELENKYGYWWYTSTDEYKYGDRTEYYDYLDYFRNVRAAQDGDFLNFLDSEFDWYIEDYVLEYISSFFIIIVYGFLFRLLMYPTKVARRNVHEQTIAITWINALFGETVIVWIAMLMWANTKKTHKADLTAQPAEAVQTVGEKMKELKELSDQGIISQEEFENKKQELLSKM